MLELFASWWFFIKWFYDFTCINTLDLCSMCQNDPIARFFFLQKQTSWFNHTHITLYNYTFLTRRTILIYTITSDNQFYCVYQIHQLCLIFFFINPIIVKALKSTKYIFQKKKMLNTWRFFHFIFNQPCNHLFFTKGAGNTAGIQGGRLFGLLLSYFSLRYVQCCWYRIIWN